MCVYVCVRVCLFIQDGYEMQMNSFSQCAEWNDEKHWNLCISYATPVCDWEIGPKLVVNIERIMKMLIDSHRKDNILWCLHFLHWIHAFRQNIFEANGESNEHTYDAREKRTISIGLLSYILYKVWLNYVKWKCFILQFWKRILNAWNDVSG